MLGKPKYNYNDTVIFKLTDKEHKGFIVIIDPYGTFDQTEEVSYDIMVKENNQQALYKHIPESCIIQICEEQDRSLA